MKQTDINGMTKDVKIWPNIKFITNNKSGKTVNIIILGKWNKGIVTMS